MPKIKLFNFLTRKKEIFKPIKKNQAGLYTCGPTVYNYAHIGNLRTYIFEDILRRTLEYAGYRVKHVMNITDVDDKTVRDSKIANKSLKEFTEFYSEAFLNDLKKLDIEPAWKYPKATGHIREMISLINVLLKKKFAYKTEDGVFFDISKFKNYGKLSRIKKAQLKVGARVNADEYAKDQAQDFVLWKAKKEGEPFWPAPFGDGRPGWHIECSAMSMKYLGKTFDIHSAGIDLLFPHHENEIAQSEAATGKKFVKYFVEGEHLLVDGKKMAKSFKNFFTLRDLETKDFNPLAFRYLVLGANYRTQLNFTWESLQAAENSLERLYEFILILKQNLTNESKLVRFNFLALNPLFGGSDASPKLKRTRLISPHLQDFVEAFQKAIFDDLNTPKALAVLQKLINDYHKEPQSFNAGEVLELVYDFDRVLGLNLKSIRSEAASTEVKAMLEEREIARKAKNFQKADDIRGKIEDLGWKIDDTPEGPRLSRRI